jgi:peptidyl-dipeptidase A
MEENIISEFLENKTKEIKPLLEKISYSYWDATTTGKEEKYMEYETSQKEISKLFNNKEDFEKIKQFLKLKIENPLVKRQLETLYNSYLGNQGDLNLINQILEKSTAIEQKFNLFRAKINNKELTDNEIKEILKNETDSGKLKEAWEASKMQGELVAADLIELIKLRNKLARSLGFSNYYVLSLKTADQTEEGVAAIFNKLDELTQNSFKRVKEEMDKFLSERYKTAELKPWHYQDLFFQEAPEIYDIDFDRFYKEDILLKAEKFYSGMGFDVSDIIKRSDLYERKGKYQHAYCTNLNHEGDIRTLMNLKNDEKWMDTVLHELGHAIYDKYVDKDLPLLIREHSHILTTEAIAQLFGRNSKKVSFIQEFCNVPSEELNKVSKEIKKSLQFRELIFSRWSQVMVNFERNLYENPDQDLNKLWWELVKKYQLLDFSRDKADWASKIHFVSSPVYYQNYLIGELFASQIIHFIAKNIIHTESMEDVSYSNNKEIGNYLKEKIFFPGAIYKWDELIKYSTGEELNPKYWVEEFC